MRKYRKLNISIHARVGTYGRRVFLVFVMVGYTLPHLTHVWVRETLP